MNKKSQVKFDWRNPQENKKKEPSKKPSIYCAPPESPFSEESFGTSPRSEEDSPRSPSPLILPQTVAQQAVDQKDSKPAVRHILFLDRSRKSQTPPKHNNRLVYSKSF